MRSTQKTYLESLTYKEKHSLKENLCEKVTSLTQYKKASLVLAYIPDSLEADCIPVILDALEKGKKVCVPKVDFEALKNGKSRMDFYFLDGAKALEEQLETGAFGIREPKSCLEKLIWGVAGKNGSEFFPAEGVAENATGGCSEGIGSDSVAGKTCEAGFERVSVKAVPEPPHLSTSPFMIVPGVAFTKSGKRLGHGKGFYDIYIEEMQKAGARSFLCGVCLPCQIVQEIPTDKHDVRMDCVIYGQAN